MQETRLALFLLPLLAIACSTPPVGEQRSHSSAFDQPAQTDVGRRFHELSEAHPGSSGLYVLGSGLDAFAARVLLIDRAERAVDVQYYIFHDDLTGRFLLSRLLAAADRGVRVRLLLDDLGTSGIDPLLRGSAAHENLEVRLFNPIARGPWNALARALDFLRRPGRLNHRMHNKLLAVDGALAVVGGRNVGDEYFDAAEGVNFADLDLLVFGPVLRELGESFDRYWNSDFVVSASDWKPLRGDRDELSALRQQLASDDAAAKDSHYAERVRTTPMLRDAESGSEALLWAPTHAYSDLPEKVAARGEDVAATLLGPQIRPIFDEARSELLIVSPYFVPKERGVEYLAAAVQRGVRVRVLTNSLAATDVPAVHAGYGRYRRPLLEGGVEIYELKGGAAVFAEAHRRGLFGSSSASLHAKTFAVDRRAVFVGSLNLDPRSVALNTELGLVVESRELAERQAAGFERMVAPERAFRLSLEDDRLVWEGRSNGATERYTSEPDTSWWTRLRVSLLALLPIEGQL